MRLISKFKGSVIPDVMHFVTPLSVGICARSFGDSDTGQGGE